MLHETTLLKFLALYCLGVILLSPYGAGASTGNMMYFLLLVPLHGLLNLICYVPMVGKMIFRKKQFLHRAVTSDIPGNPHAFDDCIISLMRTLPEPANFNVCFTGMDLAKPFRVEGALPLATINSLSLYSRTTSDPPVTLDLSTVKLAPGKRFNVILAPVTSTDTDLKALTQGDSTVGLLTYPAHWEGGFVAMRNYAVQNGTRVITPTVSSADGTVLRPPASLVAGLTAAKGLEIDKIIRVVLFNVIVFSQWKNESWSMLHRHILVGGLVAGYLFYYSLFWLGKRGLFDHISLICPHMHEFRRPDDGEASKVSQPSKEHRYWLMRFDLRSLPGSDVIVTVPMRTDGQKYWSLTLYDEYGLPIPQFVNMYNTSSCSPDSGSGQSFEIDIRLTLTPKEVSASSDATVTADAASSATVDMHQAPSGYAIFRIVHPTLPSTDALSVPVASLAKSL
jgi:hypothetical protein